MRGSGRGGQPGRETPTKENYCLMPCCTLPAASGYKERRMKLVCASLACLLLLCLAIPETQSRVLQPSIDIRSLFPKMASAAHRRSDPDIDPSWYTGRGIRPVGRFGRRGTAWGDAQNAVYRPLGQTCVPIEDSFEINDDN